MEVDLSAFPIIRLDQIHYADNDTLQKASSEIEYMLETSDNSNPKMDKYLMKQYEAMKKEITERNATLRINQLLSGAQDLLNQPIDYSTLFEQKKKAAVQSEAQSSQNKQHNQQQNLSQSALLAPEKDSTTISERKAETVKSFVPLPLPSERARMATQSKTISSEKQDTVTPLPLTSDSLSSVNDSGEQPRNSSNTSPRSINSSRSNHSRKPINVADPLEDQLSKRAMEVVYKNFGSAFVVAATEKRRRFYPVKKSTESTEEIKNREKLDRRKGAMQRLLKRREERESLQQKQREKRKLQKIAAKKAERVEQKKGNDLPALSESSDSESVSGGDDEPDIQVDDKLVETVQKALDTISHNQVEDELPIPVPPPVPTLQSRTTSANNIGPVKSITTSNANNATDNINSKRPPIVSQRSTRTTNTNNNKATVSTPPISSSSSSSSLTLKSKSVDATTKKMKSSAEEESSSSRNESTSPQFDINDFITSNETNTDRNEEFQSKNLAALMAIRKMKEAKMKSFSSSSTNLLHVDESRDEGGKEEVADAEESKLCLNDNTANHIPVIVVENKTIFNKECIQEHADVTETNLIAERKVSVDLSSTTTPINIRPSSGRPVSSSLSIVAAVPVATSARTSNSIVLNEKEQTMTKQKDLFDFVNGCYIFNYGTDDFPGLMAWKMENQWKIDLSNYDMVEESHSSSQVFVMRSKDRQQVPFGLILLCEECRDLLLGNMVVKNKPEFERLWKECIAAFDHQSNQSYQIDEQELFQSVTVCGNGFTTCRKLEKLLRQVFHLEKNRLCDDDDLVTLSQRLHVSDQSNEGGSNGDVLEPQVIEDIIKCTESVDNIADEQMRAEQILSLGNSPTVDDNNDSNIITTAGDVDGFGADNDGGDGNLLRPSSENKERPSAETNYNESFITDGVLVSSSRPSTTTSTNDSTDINSLDSKVPLSAKSSAVTSSIRKSRDGTLRSSISSIPPNVPRASNNPNNKSAVVSKEKGNRLIDYYPHFGMIFPVAYKHFGSAREDGGASAKALIESMQLQGQLYGDWVEVMKDYSTVFCTTDQTEDDSETAKEKSAEVYQGGSKTLHYRVKSSRSEVFNIISDVITKKLPHWVQLPSGLGLGLSWNLLWTWSKPHINMSHLLIWQRVNHFEDSRQLSRKDLLKKNIQRFVDIGNKVSNEFDIMPKTFILPHEYTQFIQSYTTFDNQKKEEMKSMGTTSLHNYWILKPVGLSRGRGISLITDINEITYSQASVIQKYIERPLCLHGYKFDLRIYVIVTSFRPLEAFIFRDGFARVSTQEYSLHSNDMQNKFIHLTNSSIQKYNMNDLKSNNPIATEHIDEDHHSHDNIHATTNDESSDVGGSKISLLGNHGLWNRLKAFGIDTIQLWEEICLCIIKSLVMVDEKMTYQPCCFELFGYDILIDNQLRPWLIEVNSSPSLARENHLDHRVKNALIHDIIELLDMADYDREALAKIIHKRLHSITTKKRYVYGSNDTELEQDLQAILGDYRPRLYGELPKHMGQFECLCPNTKAFDYVLKLKKKIIKPMNGES